MSEQNQPRKKMIVVKNIKKVYQMGSEKINAVNDVSFEVLDGEFCCLIGTSGSGKSTILNLLAGIEKETSGEIWLKGKNICKMNEGQLAKFRQSSLGFVFQAYNLIGTMTAVENVELPLTFKHVNRKIRRQKAVEMLKKVGLETRLNHKPNEMSGGQQQRVGIARAFVGKPRIIFADEPTGNLDTKTTAEVMALIKGMAKENNQTIVMVTHDPTLTKYADRVIRISDGVIVEQYLNTEVQEPVIGHDVAPPENNKAEMDASMKANDTSDEKAVDENKSEITEATEERVEVVQNDKE